MKENPQLNSRGTFPNSREEYPKRFPHKLECFMQHEISKRAGLVKAEVIGLRSSITILAK